MILAIDIGNIRTTVALFRENGTKFFRSEMGTDSKLTADQYAISLLDLFRLHSANMDEVSGAIISSVVPSMTGVCSKAVTYLTEKAPFIVGPGIKTGLNIRADVHNQLGSDIVASAVAACTDHPSPVIVINSHTAVSFSYISGNTFEGCAIMPGASIALEALSSNGAQLPHIAMDGVASPLGRNTVDSMRAGIIYGYAGAFDRLIEEMERAAGAPAASIVVTGENSPELFRQCRHKLVYDHDLLVNGLLYLYRKATGKTKK
ncbi:MAG: type III pantothenate kinase [Oscillospiraceae bacterium]|nr:type III pantothenate kinase [Oscillospiraceae bacterium]